MIDQFIHEEILMLFCSEKFSGWWVVVVGGGIAIIATSSRSRRFEIDLDIETCRVHMELTWTRPGPDLDQPGPELDNIKNQYLIDYSSASMIYISNGTILNLWFVAPCLFQSPTSSPSSLLQPLSQAIGSILLES